MSALYFMLNEVFLSRCGAQLSFPQSLVSTGNMFLSSVDVRLPRKHCRVRSGR